MTNAAQYLTDDRDLPEDQLRTLVIFPGGNGDWYVQVAPKNGRTSEGVRLATSGGASTNCPGLTIAIADAYRAMQRAEQGDRRIEPSRTELQEELDAWRRKFPHLHYSFGELIEE